jgi:DNA mismatch endonuclease, patch repair protein
MARHGARQRRERSAAQKTGKKREPLSLTERMRRIRKTDTKPELIVRRLVHAMGCRYRLHQSDLPGNPDIVLARHRKVILVHGCFWHRHHCADGRKLPRSKPEYWGPKLERNRRRDKRNIVQLRKLGWSVLVVWECDIRKGLRLDAALRRFLGVRGGPVRKRTARRALVKPTDQAPAGLARRTRR